MRRTRLAPETRRAAILQAALEVFAELGFERATLQEVADRARVTKGALYHYFDSKDELFIELVRSRLGDLVVESDARVAAADPGLTREELLRDHLERMWATLQQPWMLELSRLVLLELANFPDVGRAFFEEVVAPSRRTMRRILMRGQECSPADEARLDALVAALPGMLLGAALTQRVFPDIDPLQLDQEHLGRVVVDLILPGAAVASSG